jgi:hypothetical protein
VEPVIKTEKELDIESITDIAMGYIEGLLRMIDYGAQIRKRVLWRGGPYGVFYEGGNTVFRRKSTTSIAFEVGMDGKTHLAVEVHLAKRAEGDGPGVGVAYLIVRGGSNCLKLKEVSRAYRARDEAEAAEAVLDIVYRVVAHFQWLRNNRGFADFKGSVYMTERTAVAVDDRLDKLAVVAPGIWYNVFVLTPEGFREVRGSPE